MRRDPSAGGRRWNKKVGQAGKDTETKRAGAKVTLNESKKRELQGRKEEESGEERAEVRKSRQESVKCQKGKVG